jgi:hypothetical protein
MLSDVTKYRKILLPFSFGNFFIVPRDWTKNNIIEMWGSGSRGIYPGGGGGGYARIHNLDLVIDQQISYSSNYNCVFGNYIRALGATGQFGGSGEVLPAGLSYTTFTYSNLKFKKFLFRLKMKQRIKLKLKKVKKH